MRLGKYEILSVLGRGGMGVVYKARDPIIDRVVAIKTISELSEGLEHNQIERLLTEARSAGRLHHPNIVTVFDFGEENGISYIVLEYAEGLDLGHVIQLRQAISLPEKLDILLQICRGLGYAHDCGVTHRDMKPQNVRLTTSGVAKILDFGLARYDNTQLTKSGYISGTVSYMSPERLSGQSGTSDDIFALGCVAYELLTYKRAFDGEETPQILMKLLTTTPDPPSTLAEIPSSLDAIVLKCMAREIADRFASAHDFAAAIEEIFESDELQHYVLSEERSDAFRNAMKRWNTARWRRETQGGLFKPTASASQAQTEQLAAPTDVQRKPSAMSTTAPETVTVAAATEVVPISKPKSRVPLVAAASALVIAGAAAWMFHKTPPPINKEQSTITSGASVTSTAPPSTDVARVQRAYFELQQLSREVQSKIDHARGDGILISESRTNELMQQINGLQPRADRGDDTTVHTEAQKILAATDIVIRESRQEPKRATQIAEGGSHAIVTTPQRPTVTHRAPVQRTQIAAAPPPVAATPPPTAAAVVASPPPRVEASPVRETPAPQPATDAKKEIAAFLQRVANAYQSHDEGFFRENYVRYNDNLGRAIRNSPSQRVTLDVDSIEVVDAAHAQVTVHRTDDFGKEAPPARQRLRFELEKSGDRWKIVSFARQ